MTSRSVEITNSYKNLYDGNFLSSDDDFDYNTEQLEEKSEENKNLLQKLKNKVSFFDLTNLSDKNLYEKINPQIPYYDDVDVVTKEKKSSEYTEKKFIRIITLSRKRLSFPQLLYSYYRSCIKPVNIDTNLLANYILNSSLIHEKNYERTKDGEVKYIKQMEGLYFQSRKITLIVPNDRSFDAKIEIEAEPSFKTQTRNLIIIGFIVIVVIVIYHQLE